MAAVHFRTLRAAAPALLALALAACPGGDSGNGGQPDTGGQPGSGSGGGVTTGPLPPLPPGLPTPYLSGNVPTVVPPRPDSVTSPTASRPWFDVFSWQSFIALSWPASQQGRGNPQSPADSSVFLNAANGGQLTWGTYKESWELFGQGNARPSAFDDWNSPVEPCGGNLQPGQKAFEFISKTNSLFNTAAESFSMPLIDQQRGYARFEVRYNRAQYDTIRGPDGDTTKYLYLSRNWTGNIPFQMPASTASSVGSIMIKASWKPLTAQDDSTKYYHVRALVDNGGGQGCQPTLMGLVGLHIVQKTNEFPQWIWSTFEHVSNVPGQGAVPNGQGTYSYNNGTPNPLTPGGWANRPATLDVLPVDQRVPVQVTRLNPIPTTPQGSSTADINNIYQSYLKNTVWANYQLVMTQWPSQPSQFTLVDSGGVYPSGSGYPFPQFGVTNTTMETYVQSRQDAQPAGGNSCMQCHWNAGETDFSWGLKRRAH
ncbi:hypothetical protein [Longimicrobium sp.]|uniref:hypothetical protein n=1 Tax=Longimicrobium sp. TaxID=2029185 RepID=UPI002E359EFE|nr:hypothetical protein [Longimicrobium sp.]HEX6039503.1 hypothetical protein [Longimicrobium sp.]